jgi:hypothetical protein
MNDPDLVREMGQSALVSVQDRHISSVVDGLLGWYARGMHNRKQSSLIGNSFKVLVLAVSTPLTFLVLWLYDVVVSVCVVILLYTLSSRLSLTAHLSVCLSVDAGDLGPRVQGAPGRHARRAQDG